MNRQLEEFLGSHLVKYTLVVHDEAFTAQVLANIGPDAKDAAPAARPDAEGRRSARPKPTEVADLKPGLFVEVEARRAEDGQRATRVVVVRPFGGPQTPASEEKPPAK